MLPDLIVLNGNVRTMDPGHPSATALVARGGEIIYVGSDADARAYASRESTIVDARGHLVLPGFMDSHLHFCGYAQGLDRVNLEGCRSLEEVVARVAERVGKARPGQWIVGHSWNHMDWDRPVFPDKRPLDPVSPNNPVILTRKDGHSAWVNSAALQLSGITRETADPEGGKFERDAEGDPTGLVRENAMDLLGRGIGQSEDEIPLDALERAIANAHRAGLVGVCSIEGTNAVRAWQALARRGPLRFRVVHGIPDLSLDHAVALGIERGFGDEWFRLQAVKIFADGSLGSQTAEMFEPFIGSDGCGMAVTSTDEILRFARTAAQAGLDVWTHAIGDSAIARVLSVYETLRGEGLTDNIFRIEHVQHIRRADIPRFRAANVIASVQPIHQPSDMKMAEHLLGPARSRYTYPFRSLLEAGATLAFGSDCPVEGLEPLRGIQAAVTRQNLEGEPAEGWFPEERLSVEEAVAGFTRGAAMATGDMDRAGTLSVGKRADAVILARDLFTIPPGEIAQTPIDYTIVGGEVVYERN